MNMPTLAQTKIVVKFAVTVSVGHVVKNVINNTCSPETAAAKAKVAVGSYVIAGIVVEKASVYVDTKFDAIVQSVAEAKQKNDDSENK